MNDGQSYHATAISLLEGKGYLGVWTLEPTAQWPPGYSFLLAGLYFIFGRDVSVAWAANVVLGGLTCVALYFLGNLAGGKKLGIVAGLLLAVFPGHIFFSSLVLSEVLFTFLVVVIMALVLLALRRSDAGPGGSLSSACWWQRRRWCEGKGSSSSSWPGSSGGSRRGIGPTPSSGRRLSW